MMKRSILVCLCVLATVAPANADWLTTVENDLFSGGKQAFMTSDPRDQWVVVGSCSQAEGIHLAVVESNSTDVADGLDPSTIIVKPDNGNQIRSDGTFYRHNANSVGVSFDQAYMIPVVLQAAGKAKKSISIGLRIETSGYQRSYTISAKGSQVATDLFREACGLQ